MPGGTELGERIRRLRLARNLTLKQVEQKAKVSATHISEIERGLTSPTVGALTRIAEAVGVEPSRLLRRKAMPAVSVVRRGKERRLNDSLWAGEIRLLSAGIADAEMTLAELELAGDRGPDPRPFVVDGEVFLHVISGEIEVIVGSDRYRLSDNDSLHFDGARPHEIRNASIGQASVLWIVSPALTL